VNKAPQQVI